MLRCGFLSCAGRRSRQARTDSGARDERAEATEEPTHKAGSHIRRTSAKAERSNTDEREEATEEPTRKARNHIRRTSALAERLHAVAADDCGGVHAVLACILGGFEIAVDQLGEWGCGAECGGLFLHQA